MKRLVKSKKEKAEADEVIFRHDCECEEPDSPIPCFRYSKAKISMKHDLKKAFASGEFPKPMALWRSRPEYQEFSLETFRSCFFSMKAKMIAMPYWSAKRNKNAHRIHLEKAERMNREYDDIQLANQMKAMSNLSS